MRDGSKQQQDQDIGFVCMLSALTMAIFELQERQKAWTDGEHASIDQRL